MNTEIEAKFVRQNHQAMRDKLAKLGAVCEKPMRLMRRVTIDNPSMVSKNAFMRVRDEGDRITMTYKQFDELSLHGAKEIEIIVDDFDNAVQLLKVAGLPYQSFQESRRETWRLGGVEIVLDEWPWLDPYIEIEGDSENEVKEVASKLGLSWKDAVFGDVMEAYRVQYPHISKKDTVGHIRSVKFGDPLPDMLKSNS